MEQKSSLLKYTLYPIHKSNIHTQRNPKIASGGKKQQPEAEKCAVYAFIPSCYAESLLAPNRVIIIYV